MDVQDIQQFLWVVMATIALASSRDEQCDQKVVLGRGQTIHIDVIQMTTERRDCVMEFNTKARWRIVLTFNYKPAVSNYSIAEDCAYSSDYLLVGNDFTAIGQEVMTSYKYCRETGEGEEEEIVSRDNHMWLVLRGSAQQHQHHHQHQHRHRHQPHHQRNLLSLKATALPEVRCGDQEMECSPVQCVSSGAVCDGQRDCTNGRDEYCYHLNDIAIKSEPPPPPPITTVEEEEDQTTNHNHKNNKNNNNNNHNNNHNYPTSPQTQLPLPPKDTACFLCRDGTCILPRLPRYDYRWGVWLWYLCDGVPHCPDGWDEQPYMCYLSRHFPQLAQRHLFQCEAYTQAPQEGSPQGESPQTPPPFSRQVRMWSLARCDDRRDCRLPEEEGKERCENMLGVSSRSEASSVLYLNPPALCLVIIFAVVVVIIALLVLRYIDRIQEPSATRRRIRSILRTGSGRRDDDDGGGGGGSEEDRDDSTNSSDAALECSSVLQTGCLSVRSILVIADKATLSHHDFERLRETTV